MKRFQAAFLFGAALLAVSACFSQSSPSRQQQLNSHAQKAQQDLSEHRLAAAAAEFRAILAIDPTNTDVRANLGVLLFFQGKYAGALPELRGALKQRPSLWKIQALLGIAEKRTGDFKQARTDLASAFPNVRDKKIRIETGMELVDLYSKTGDLDQAAAAVSALRKIEPTNPAILYSSYRIYSELTEQSTLSLMLVAPKSAYLHELMGLELAKHGHPKEAAANFREAIKIDPKLPGPHYELAELLYASDATRAQAEQEYEQALALNPFDVASECRLGEIAVEQGDLKQAYARYARAIKLRPDDAQANLGMAEVLMSMGRIKEAQPLAERSVELDPTNSVAYFRLSTIYRRNGEPAKARSTLAQYQKYKALKQQLRTLYHTLRVEPSKPVSGDEQQPPQ